MKPFLAVWGALFFVAALVGGAAMPPLVPPEGGGVPLRVRGIEGRVAVYATTNAVREAVAWVPSGTEFAVRGELPDESVWVHVEPPDHVSVWVYRELVRDGVVLADKVRIRAGAGLSFHAIGTLNKGECVEVRGTYGDWLRIKPPADVGFWVLRDQVEPLALMPPEGVADERQAIPQSLVTNAGPESVAGGVTNLAGESLLAALRTPPELAGLPLLDSPDQGAQVSLAGLLDWGLVGGLAAAPFCLIVRQADGSSVPVCHVIASESSGQALVGQDVRVRGGRWQVKGVELPVVIAERLLGTE